VPRPGQRVLREQKIVLSLTIPGESHSVPGLAEMLFGYSQGSRYWIRSGTAPGTVPLRDFRFPSSGTVHRFDLYPATQSCKLTVAGFVVLFIQLKLAGGDVSPVLPATRQTHPSTRLQFLTNC